MPVYNGEKYVREALDALLAQTYTDFELIISDNASTDCTERICRDYAKRDSRISYIRQSVNIGAAKNFQYVLNAARGEYFMWAAYDDYWKPHFIAHCLDALSDESIGFAFPAFALKSIRLGIYKKIPATVFKKIEDPDRNRRVLGFANLHQSSHKCNLVYSLFRTSVLREAYSIQDITNDGLMSMVILGSTRGAITKEVDFFKRYPFLWPGFRRKKALRQNKVALFEKIRDESNEKAKSLFPELAPALDRICSKHEAGNHKDRFEIIKDLLEPS